MKLFIFFTFVLINAVHLAASSGHSAKDVLLFLVRIEAKDKILDCAGTILSPTIVLTSAHCVEGFPLNSLTVKHFVNSLNIYSASQVYVHPDYEKDTLRNDIALLEINKDFVEPWVAVSLNNATKISQCTIFQIVGWSNDVDDPNKSIGKPMTAPVKLIPNTECTTALKEFGGTFEGREKMCGITNDDGECFTGPGGPLLCSVGPEIPTKATVSQTTTKQTTPLSTSPTTRRTTKVVAVKSVTVPKPKTKNETFEGPIDLLVNWLSPTSTAPPTRRHKRKPAPKPRTKEEHAPILQVGVVSWGKSCSKIPSVYIRTEKYNNWIRRHVSYIERRNEMREPAYNFLTPLKGSVSRFTSDRALVVIAVVGLLSRPVNFLL